MNTFSPCRGCADSKSAVCEEGNINGCICPHCWELWVIYEDGECDSLLPS